MDPVALQQTYQQLLDKLGDHTKALQGEYQAYMQCQKGCSHCCLSGFGIRYVEMLRLLEFIQDLPQETLQTIYNQLHSTDAEVQKFCPLLVNGACSVYEGRPILCRAYGLVVAMNDTHSCCRLNFTNLQPETPLKALNLAPYYELADELADRLWQEIPDHLLKQEDETIAPFMSIKEMLLRVLSVQGR